MRKHVGWEGLDMNIFQSSPDKLNAMRVEELFCRCSAAGRMLKTVNTSVSKVIYRMLSMCMGFGEEKKKNNFPIQLTIFYRK